MGSHTIPSAPILAGDIGGTKTLLGLFAPAVRRPTRVAVHRAHTSSTTSPAALITDFLNQHNAMSSLERIVLGVAGPVFDGRAQLTNHPWTVDAHALTRTLGVPVEVINDLEALAQSLGVLDSEETETLWDGHPDPVGTRAVLAAGTGFGEAHVSLRGGQPHTCPSEGGHADFAPRTPQEDQMVLRLRRRHGRATVEHVLSGPGLVALHELTHDDRPCPQVAASSPVERPAAVASAALGRLCGRCEEALRLFVSAYGSEAGNLALRTMATGGVYVGGGIATHVRAAFGAGGFVDAFLDKAPMRPLLERVPVRVIVTPEASLIGASVVAQRHLR